MEPEATHESNSPTAPEQANLQPDIMPIPTDPNTGHVRRRFPKKLILIFGLLVLLVGAAVAFAVYYDNVLSKIPAKQSIVHLSLPNQPKQSNLQYGTQFVTTAYVSYAPEKLKLSETTIPPVASLVPAVAATTDHEVIFMSDLSGQAADSPSRRLLMYDVTTQKTYVVAEDSSIGSYSNASVLSNHYVVYASESQSDPVTSTVAIQVADLSTGTTKTILQDKAGNLPANLCCSVSPDGLRLVIPRTNHFEIYQAGDTTATTFSGSVEPFPQVSGSDNSDYAASQRNTGYPGVVWLNENQFVYAKANPLAWTVDDQGSHQHANTDDGLAIYDLRTNAATDINRTDGVAIRWFTVTGKAILLAGYSNGISSLTIYKLDDYSDASSQLLEIASQPSPQSSLFYDQSEQLLYVLPSSGDVTAVGSSPPKTIQVVHADTGEVTALTIQGIDYPSLEGVVGPHQLLINNSYGVNNSYYFYNTQTNAAEPIFSYASAN